MSEKFGLDWENYDYQRMKDLMLIHHIINNPKDASSNRTSTTDSRKMNRDGN